MGVYIKKKNNKKIMKMKDFGSLKNHEPTEIIKNRGWNICGSIWGYT